MTADGATPGANAPPPWFVLLAVAASGAASMCVELASVRALQPFFGSSALVWTNVIAVVLAALALGAALGGTLADRRPGATLLFALLASGGVLTAASAVAATPAAKLFLAAGVDLEGARTLLLKGSLGAALAVFAPPLVPIGMVAPLAVRLVAATGPGRAAGRVLAVSTAASIAGAYLATFALVPGLGSRATLLAAAAFGVVPAAAGLVAFCGRRGAIGAAAAVLVTATVAVRAETRPSRDTAVFSNGGVAKVLTERESPYQYLTVREDSFPTGEVDTVLTINEGVYIFHALEVRGQVLTDSRHYDDYTVLPMLVDAPAGGDLRVGVIGFACGVNAAQLRHFWRGPFRLSVEGAEIDPEVVALGREHFGLPGADDASLRVTVADGRTWLASLPRGATFHALVIDAFANEAYMPFHLATREFLELCRERLAPGGVLAMNVYAVGADAASLAALENTLATVFGACVRSSRYRGFGFLLLARRGDEAPDLRRLESRRIAQRFGERPGVAEWAKLVDLAAEVARDSTLVRAKPGARVLTDDDAPLEYLTDRFVGELEDRMLVERARPGAAGDEGIDLAAREARESGRSAALRELSGRQDRLLAAVAAAWAIVALAASVAVRRA